MSVRLSYLGLAEHSVAFHRRDHNICSHDRTPAAFLSACQFDSRGVIWSERDKPSVC